MKWLHVLACAAVFFASLETPVLSAKVLGVRGGISDQRTQEDYRQIDVFSSWHLAGQKDRHWLGFLLNGSMGLLWTEDDKSALVAGVGPGVTLGCPGDNWQIEAGVDVAVLTRHNLGRDDFGGPLHFITHGGARWRINSGWHLGYRFQHMSNAGLYASNPGLNLHMIAAGVAF